MNDAFTDDDLANAEDRMRQADAARDALASADGKAIAIGQKVAIDGTEYEVHREPGATTPYLHPAVELKGARFGVVHEDRPDCWCRPTRNYKDPVTGTEVWVHREAVE